MKSLILIIDDDEKLNALLTEYLSDFGFEIISSVHPENGLTKIRKRKPALVVLDIMLPGMNGFEVCKAIRAEYTVPIIMLTARGDVTDRIVGLELGADDYLAKPFEPRELVARIQSILRRTSPNMDLPVQSFAELEVDHSKREARLRGLSLDLTTNEFNALALLVKHPGKVLDRDQILQELRGMDCDAFNRSVDITMSRLRQKIGDDPKQPKYIKTIWGTGYVFIGEP